LGVVVVCLVFVFEFVVVCLVFICFFFCNVYRFLFVWSLGVVWWCSGKNQ
jgi:hypothetical protein